MKEGIKCQCGGMAKHKNNLKFNNYEIQGWVCSKCGEIYYNPEQAQSILLLNKIKKNEPTVKLGRIKSNLIVRIPKDVERALNLEKGEEVKLRLEGKTIKIIPR